MRKHTPYTYVRVDADGTIKQCGHSPWNSIKGREGTSLPDGWTEHEIIEDKTEGAGGHMRFDASTGVLDLDTAAEASAKRKRLRQRILQLQVQKAGYKEARSAHPTIDFSAEEAELDAAIAATVAEHDAV